MITILGNFKTFECFFFQNACENDISAKKSEKSMENESETTDKCPKPWQVCS